MIPLLEHLAHFLIELAGLCFRQFHHLQRQASHAGNIHTKTSGALTLNELVKESYTVTVLVYSAIPSILTMRFTRHVVALDAGDVAELLQKHVIMRAEKRSTPDIIYYISHHSTCYRETVES